MKPCPYLRYGAQASYRNCAALAAVQFFSSRSQNGMLHSVRLTELFVKNNSRQGMNFPSENSTIISAHAHSAQTYEALPVSMIRRAGLIQKLRSFSCNAIFQFFDVTGSVHLTGSITILLQRSAYPYVHQLCSIFVIIVAAIKYIFSQYKAASYVLMYNLNASG